MKTYQYRGMPMHVDGHCWKIQRRRKWWIGWSSWNCIDVVIADGFYASKSVEQLVREKIDQFKEQDKAGPKIIQ